MGSLFMAKWNKGMPARLVKAMREGHSFTGACGVLEIGRKTGYEWAERYPEFAAAKAIGMELRLKYLEEKSIECIDRPQDRNATMIIFLLKNADRDNYGDAAKLVIPTDPLDNMDDATLEKKAIEVMRQRGLKIVRGNKKTS
jgi:hypothetical protein